MQHPGKALMSPGVGIDMHGDPQAMQTIGSILFDNGLPHHLSGDGAVRLADKLVDELADGILAFSQSVVAGQEMKGDPDQVVGQVIGIARVKHVMGGTDAGIEGLNVKMDRAAAGGIVHILGGMGDNLGLVPGKPGQAGGNIGGGVMEINLHLFSPFSFFSFHFLI